MEPALVVAFSRRPQDVAAEVRANTAAPLLVVADADPRDRAATLGIGADVCLHSSETPELIAAQALALLWRSSRVGRPGAILEAGGLHLDLEARRAERLGEELALAPREFDLLAALLERVGRAVRRHELLDAVWGPTFVGAPNTVDVHVSWLRQKLGPGCGLRITTLRGVGYRLDVL